MPPLRVRFLSLALLACSAVLAAPGGAGAFSLGGHAGGRLIAPGRVSPAAISDLAGGMIVASRDATSGIAVLNRYSPSGAALWDLGVSFPDAVGLQLEPDGNGGALFAVQHADSPTMTVGRILQSGATTWQASFPVGTLISGGDGGAWVVSQAGELFVDGVSAGGDLRPRVQLTASPDGEALPTAIGDGEGGAYLAWRATRSESVFALLLQHLTSDATLWDRPAEVAGSNESSLTPSLARDGRGGVLVSWHGAGVLWVHDYDATGLPAWNQALTIPTTSSTAAVVGDRGAAFVAWSVLLRGAPLPQEQLHVSYIGPTGSMWWTRNVATVAGGVLDVRMIAQTGAAVLAWQSASLPVVGASLDPDLSIYRVTSGGAETYDPSRRALADSLGPETLGSLVDAGSGTVTAVFTQAPCLRADVSGVAMQRIFVDGRRAFGADGACP